MIKRIALARAQHGKEALFHSLANPRPLAQALLALASDADMLYSSIARYGNPLP